MLFCSALSLCASSNVLHLPDIDRGSLLLLEYRYYPGRAAANVSFSIGGKTDIPIESVRLKHVRDGFEDNEWLRLLEKHKGRTHVLKLIQPFISNAWTFADNAAALLSARAAVGAAIQEAELKARSPVALSQDNLSDDIL